MLPKTGVIGGTPSPQILVCFILSSPPEGLKSSKQIFLAEMGYVTTL